MKDYKIITTDEFGGRELEVEINHWARLGYVLLPIAIPYRDHLIMERTIPDD